MKTTRRAFFMAEAVTGLGLLTVSALVLFVALSRGNLAGRRLADARQSTRACEAVLMNLQAGLPAPPPEAGTQVQIKACANGASPKGTQWVEVVATVRGQTRTLIGLIPEGQPQTAPSERSAP